MIDNSDFLNSIINENNAEYNILYALRAQCDSKNFLLQIYNIEEIKNILSELVSYITNEYKSYELTLFSLNKENKFEKETINTSEAQILDTEFLINISQSFSRKNKAYVLVNYGTNFFLVFDGEIVNAFDGLIENKNSLRLRNNEKLDINHLEEAFENYMSYKRYNGCDYVKKVNGKPKVIDNILEQTLRNDLFKFLKKRTKLFVVPELCTSLSEDEESVDVALVDEDNEMAIIEVKFFVKKGFFISDSTPAMHSFVRFRDGYNQLNRYCIHLDSDNIYDIRYAYLYMFYAHSDSLEKIKLQADKYHKEFLKSLPKEETLKFRQHYKKTIFDNMVDVVV